MAPSVGYVLGDGVSSEIWAGSLDNSAATNCCRQFPSNDDRATAYQWRCSLVCAILLQYQCHGPPYCVGSVMSHQGDHGAQAEQESLQREEPTRG